MGIHYDDNSKIKRNDTDRSLYSTRSNTVEKQFPPLATNEELSGKGWKGLTIKRPIYHEGDDFTKACGPCLIVFGSRKFMCITPVNATDKNPVDGSIMYKIKRESQKYSPIFYRFNIDKANIELREKKNKLDAKMEMNNNVKSSEKYPSMTTLENAALAKKTPILETGWCIYKTDGKKLYVTLDDILKRNENGTESERRKKDLINEALELLEKWDPRVREFLLKI